MNINNIENIYKQIILSPEWIKLQEIFVEVYQKIGPNTAKVCQKSPAKTILIRLREGPAGQNHISQPKLI